MRDILVVSIVILGALIALRRPWIGVMLWTWLSLMNPHRYTWGFAYDMKLAAIAAASTLMGLLITKERESPFKGAPAVILAVFMCWMTLSWRMGLDPAGDHEAWDKAMKVSLMVLVSLALLHSKKHIFALAWVCAGSLAILGAKGGAFTILNGGNYKVWGPEGSFIADNNHFALALVMTIPLLRFLQMQLQHFRGRQFMTLTMVLVAAAALGSHSRGAFLAIIAMTLLLWWRGRSRLLGGVLIAAVALSLLLFMPDEWAGRMSTIGGYEEDTSARGRFSAWWVSWRVALDYPLGVGFLVARDWLFAKYSPEPGLGIFVAHSIYFQILGNHGFGGLFLFLLLWATTWWSAFRIRHEAKGILEARWCIDLANMAQVSLAGYAVGGAFLNLAYFDLPYYVMSLVVLTRVWVKTRGWEREPVYPPGWKTIPGLATRAQPATKPTVPAGSGQPLVRPNVGPST